jgi:hypothetical protein
MGYSPPRHLFDFGRRRSEEFGTLLGNLAKKAEAA